MYHSQTVKTIEGFFRRISGHATKDTYVRAPMWRKNQIRSFYLSRVNKGDNLDPHMEEPELGIR